MVEQQNLTVVYMRHVVLSAIVLSVIFLCVPSFGNAFEAFGFKSGMSQEQVELAVKDLGLGLPKRMGESLMVSKPDSSDYLFNFCSDKLYSVSQSFPVNFDRLASFTADMLEKKGQPIYVSAFGGMGLGGYVRPINLYWKISDLDYLRVMQLSSHYSIVYEAENSCTKVPR